MRSRADIPRIFKGLLDNMTEDEYERLAKGLSKTWDEDWTSEDTTFPDLSRGGGA